jgi:hypothetical protein
MSAPGDAEGAGDEERGGESSEVEEVEGRLPAADLATLPAGCVFGGETTTNAVSDAGTASGGRWKRRGLPSAEGSTSAVLLLASSTRPMRSEAAPPPSNPAAEREEPLFEGVPASAWPSAASNPAGAPLAVALTPAPAATLEAADGGSGGRAGTVTRVSAAPTAPRFSPAVTAAVVGGRKSIADAVIIDAHLLAGLKVAPDADDTDEASDA